MMMNLFNSFDPSNFWNLSLNWMSSMIFFMVMPSMFWLIPSRFNFLLMNLFFKIHQEFKILLNKNYGNTLVFIALFYFILLNNLLGLFPYIFTSSSHMTLTLTMALPLWLTFMIFGWFNKTFLMLAHLIPTGTPPILMPFMICIETISNIIRPGTLAIRLSANMIAGHLLLTLLGNTGSLIGLLFLQFLIITQLLLLLLETAVALIQSYVFVILSTLYSSEVN
uniref:ATP synthase subunit a n=1 Tax=Discolomatinae sp. GENSP01 TaxID=1205622 RepID=A0A0S2MNQ8_9CUCU|nr:ATP synthase F0 subunit 6 [Discolomatinae sp. GENSP01]